MNEVLTTHIANSEVSHTLETVEKSCSSKSIQFKLTLFSWKRILCDARFEYRLTPASAWSGDAVLSSSQSCSVKGNVLSGVEAGQGGSTYAFNWVFSENGFVEGENCEVRIVLSPQPETLSRGDNSTFAEDVSFSLVNHIGTNYDHVVVNRGLTGKALCISGSSVYGLTTSGAIEWEFSVSNPVYALEKNDGRILVAYNSGNVIGEFTLAGVQIKALTNAARFQNAVKFAYNERLDTVLVAGNTRPYVTEFSWADDNFATILWTHGDGVVGNNPKRLSTPSMALYQPNDYSTIWVADTGNNRVLRVNRNTNTVTLTTACSVSGKTVYLQGPYDLMWAEDGFFVIEQEQKQQLYGETAQSHVGIIRYQSETMPVPVQDENATSAYRNLLFIPLRRTIE